MKIAVVGSGIAGMGAAYMLAQHHDVWVYEQEQRIGGHARTLDVDTKDGNIPVDTGFIVFNHHNYPLLTGLFRHLDVPTAKSDMSFGVSINQGWLEYGTLKLSDMLAQKRNLMRWDFLRLIYDILRFNRKAMSYAAQHPQASLADCLQALGMGPWFRDYYLLAMGGAIWSTPLNTMLQFPAQTLINFFDNHGLLSVGDDLQWYTVQGGSRAYVQRLTASYADKIMLGRGVRWIKRREDGRVDVCGSDGQTDTYDQVVLACHSDQALALHIGASPQERNMLAAIAYHPNRVVLHKDASFMPRRKSAWSSWVYLSDQQQDTSPAVSLSYWMNNLQPLATREQIFVTLNPARQPKDADDTHSFDHPVFDRQAIDAQRTFTNLQGQGGIWYCGAWLKHGFHEDGLRSAVEVVQRMGHDIPWQ